MGKHHEGPGHTPGPWKVSGERTRESILWITNDAGDPRDEYDILEDLTEEDARLIAAAPSMAEEIERLRAEIETLRAERDAIAEMCVMIDMDSGERWSFVGDFGPVPYRSLVRSHSQGDAIKVVRRAAGLDHDQMTDEEVKEELDRRGIDLTEATQRVRAALKAAITKAQGTPP